MSPSVIVPVSGSCSVAMMRISVDLPAPFGPSSPYIPAGIVRVTSFSACTPLDRSWRRRESVVPCGLLLPLEDEVVAARVESQFRAGPLLVVRRNVRSELPRRNVQPSTHGSGPAGAPSMATAIPCGV